MHSDMAMPSMGVLDLRSGTEKFRLSRHVPTNGRISFFVKHFWLISWDLAGQPHHEQDVIPNPCVNLVVERGKTYIYGSSKRKYTQLLQGKGSVLGVKFKPGGFYPFLKSPVSRITAGFMGIEDVFGVGAAELEEAILAQEDEAAMVRLAEQLLFSQLPEEDETVPLLNRMIDAIVEDRGITKVDMLCDRFHMHKRTLQRMFDQYVGVNPKWVIKLYRLQDAAETIDLGHSRDWLQLAMDLGYCDQSHFIKDFKAIIGVTPVEYVQRSERARTARGGL
jgi:AraC-like DNA-binding protein